MYTWKDKKEVAKNYFSWKEAKERIVSFPKEGIELEIFNVKPWGIKYKTNNPRIWRSPVAEWSMAPALTRKVGCSSPNHSALSSFFSFSLFFSFFSFFLLFFFFFFFFFIFVKTFLLKFQASDILERVHNNLIPIFNVIFQPPTTLKLVDNKSTVFFNFSIIWCPILRTIRNHSLNN